MAIRNMRTEGDDILRKKSRVVENFDRRLWDLLDDMGDTLTQQNGVGLAAVQVGALRRVFIIDVGDENGVIEFINPEILEQSGSQRVLEGCLSFPGQWGMVRWFEQTGEGLMAQAMVHEYEHLDGHAFKEDPTFTPVSEEELEAMTNGEG